MLHFMAAIDDLSTKLIAFHSGHYLLHSIETLAFHYVFYYIRNQRILNRSMPATILERLIKKNVANKYSTLNRAMLTIVPARFTKTLFTLINIKHLYFKDRLNKKTKTTNSTHLKYNLSASPQFMRPAWFALIRSRW